MEKVKEAPIKFLVIYNAKGAAVYPAPELWQIVPQLGVTVKLHPAPAMDWPEAVKLQAEMSAKVKAWREEKRKK